MKTTGYSIENQAGSESQWFDTKDEIDKEIKTLESNGQKVVAKRHFKVVEDGKTIGYDKDIYHISN